MIAELSGIVSETTLILLLISIGIFGSLAVQARSYKSFQFHISIIVMIWIVGEVVHIANDLGMINLTSFMSLPDYIHLSSMVIIGVVFWGRFYYARRVGRTIVDELYD